MRVKISSMVVKWNRITHSSHQSKSSCQSLLSMLTATLRILWKNCWYGHWPPLLLPTWKVCCEESVKWACTMLSVNDKITPISIYYIPQWWHVRLTTGLHNECCGWRQQFYDVTFLSPLLLWRLAPEKYRGIPRAWQISVCVAIVSFTYLHQELIMKEPNIWMPLSG